MSTAARLCNAECERFVHLWPTVTSKELEIDENGFGKYEREKNYDCFTISSFFDITFKVISEPGRCCVVVLRATAHYRLELEFFNVGC